MNSYLLKSLPNGITLLRLFLIPFFVVLMVEPTPWMLFSSILIFIFAALTDFLDGMLARKYGAVSELGKLLDPLADKILVMAALVMLTAQRSDVSGEPWVPGWMVVVVLAREIWVTGLRGVAATRGVVVAASDSGKIKSVLQMVAIVLLLIHNKELTLLGYVFNGQGIGIILLSISLLFSVWGAAEYTSMVVFNENNRVPAEALGEAVLPEQMP